jgi:hypothetical protein
MPAISTAFSPPFSFQGDTVIPSKRLPRATEPAQTDIEFDVKGVTRLYMVLDTGLSLTFDLEGKDSYEINENFSRVKMGSRDIHIATARILYYETEPQQVKRTRVPLTEVMQGLQK